METALFEATHFVNVGLGEVEKVVGASGDQVFNAYGLGASQLVLHGELLRLGPTLEQH